MSLVNLLISVVIAGLIFYVVWWFLEKINLPEPFDKVAKVVVALIAILFLVGLFTGHTHTVLPFLRR